MTVNRTKDITGQTFGSLTAIRFVEVKNRMAHWEYSCKCGKMHITRANTVTHRSIKKNDPELPSCGCVELVRKTKHGFRTAKDTHPAYKVFRGMLDRCNNPNSPGYKWYGALGVTVCDEWTNNPKAFVEWAIENGFQKGLHIDKDILCDQLGTHPHVYSPDTCQWVTAKVNISYATNRDNFGRHPNVRLSNTDVAEIVHKHFMLDISVNALATQYGVTNSSIYPLIRAAKRAV